MFSRKSSAAVPEKVPQAKAAAISQPQVASDEDDSSSAQPTPLPTEAAQKQALHALRQSLAFAQIVSLLLRSPLYRHFALGDLEWLVIPPLASGMFAVAEVKAQSEGPAFPAAAVLWASVSPEVDARLSQNLESPIRLRPDEWRSGDRLWIVAAVGDQRVTGRLLQQLSSSTIQGRQVSIRVTRGDGKTVLSTLDEIFAAKTDAAA